MRNHLALFLLTLTLAGCVTRDVRHGGIPGAIQSADSIYVAPFHNATPNPAAARAITDLTVTTLASHGLPLVQSESALASGYELLEAGRAPDTLQLARSVGASHAIVGSVHEYRFKSDLDGAPTVGLTMRLVETATGQTVWQGSSSRSSGYYSSLTGTAQNAIDQLVGEMTGQHRRRWSRASTRKTLWPRKSSASVSRFSRQKSSKPEIEYEQIRRSSDTYTTTQTETYELPPPLPASTPLPPAYPTYSPAPTPRAPTPAPPPSTVPLDSQWIPVR